MKKRKRSYGLDLQTIRNAVADYMYSEGCHCCRDEDAHIINRKRIARLLKVPKKDGWYNFDSYRTKK